MTRALPDVFSVCCSGNRWFAVSPGRHPHGPTFEWQELHKGDCVALHIPSADCPDRETALLCPGGGGRNTRPVSARLVLDGFAPAIVPDAVVASLKV